MNVSMGKIKDSLSFQVSRSSGPGGQNVNKVSTRVTVVLDVRACDYFNAYQKRRIWAKLATRCDKEGRLRVVSQKHRTQAGNRRAVLERLKELLEGALQRPKSRIATKPTRSSRERRLDAKRKQGAIKQQRRFRAGDE